jgi:hypothetical protein
MNETTSDRIGDAIVMFFAFVGIVWLLLEQL